MANSNLNLIAGDWVAGESEVENRNPSDLSDLIGMFAQASTSQLDATLDQARQAQKEWAAYGIERKHNVLMAIGN
jgi:aldehyde dehydrogenase (NAD+)